MADEKKIEGLIEKALDQFGTDEEILALLDPCSKLIVTLKLWRGEALVEYQTSYQIAKQRGADLVHKDAELSSEDWVKLWALPEFSQNPERRNDQKMNAMLVEMQANEGCILQQAKNASTVARINEVLEAKHLTYRVISFRPEKGSYQFKIVRII